MTAARSGAISLLGSGPEPHRGIGRMMSLLLILNRRVRVRLGNDADVTPGAQLPDLGLAVPPLPDDGPVLIQVEYRIAPGNVAAFLRAIHAIERTRRRNGADDWRVPGYR